MRKLVVTENITFDGVIDASEGWFAPAGALPLRGRATSYSTDG
jgi:hypothetical protein